MRRRVLERISFTDVSLWLVGGSIGLLVIVGSVATLTMGRFTTRQWLDFVVTGVAQGSIYAMIALGYTLVYGVLRMINFAHSEVFMGGAFTGFFVADSVSRSGLLERNPFFALALVIGVAMVTSITVAVLLERIAYRPLRRSPRLIPLITAIGASFFLQYTFRGFYGSAFKSYPEVRILKGTIAIGSDLVIQRLQILVIVTAALFMLALHLFVQRTKTGKAMRAVSEDKDVAALMGIDVDRIIVVTFILGGALAGAAGVLYSLMFRQVQFFMGFIPGIKAFTAAVLGGIGNIPGAMLGGLFLGIFESLGPTLFLTGLGVPAPYQLKDVVAFVMLVLVLIFRPTGILGERIAVKKA